jgi:hypothetical protein
VIFNFYLGNHRSGGLLGMADLIVPIYEGLQEAGHHVAGFAVGMREAPTVNVLVEFFPDDEFVELLLKMKSSVGDKFVFGVICTEDLEDALVMQQAEFPRRRANLERVLPAADFVWTLLPQVPLYEAIAGPGKVKLLEYGFSERLLPRSPLSDATLRDIDVLMYGNATPHRMQVVGELQRRGLACFVTDRQIYPEFVASDLARRAKVLLDIRRGPGVRFPSPTRISKGLHSGTLVVAEDLGPSPIANLYKYTLPCGIAEMPDRCQEMIRGGTFARLGQHALTTFRTETSMAENLRRAMELPVFERLGRS